MRRNNGWLAILAVAVVLSTLRNSLAGERYPLDYGNAELPVNRTRATHGTRVSNGPSPSSLNRPNLPSFRDSSKLSSSTGQTSQSDLPAKKNTIVSKDASKAISWQPTKIKDANLPDEDSTNDRSILRHNLHESRLADRLPVDHSFERSNNVRTSGSGVQTAKESIGFSSKIPEERRLFFSISRAAIKGTTKGTNYETHRLGKPFTKRSHKTATSETIRRGSELLDLGYPYYDHVEPDSRDDNSLTTSGGEIGYVGRRRGSTEDLRGTEIERSDRVNGQKTVGNFRAEDIGSSGSLKNSKTSKIVRKGYLTEDVSTDHGSNARLVLNKSTVSERLKHKGRGSKSVYNLINSRHGLGMSERNSGKIPGDEPRIFVPSTVINFETSYFSHNSKTSNCESRNERFETDETERGNHHSSRFEGFQQASPSHKSTVVKRKTESTHELDGISSKQRSRIGNDDQEDRGTQYSPSTRERRNVIPSGDTVVLNLSRNEETLWNVTFNETTETFLNNETDRAGNTEHELELDSIQDSVANNLLNDQNFTSSVPDTNNTRSETNTLLLSNESDTKTGNANIESVNSTSLEEQSVPNTNNSQLDTNALKLNNGSVLLSPNASRDLIDGTELDASWREIEETQEDANKATPEVGSALSNVTKESENVVVNSQRDSVVAQRNPTYPRYDMNSLDEGFLSKSSGLSQFGGRNADDPFKNSSWTERWSSTRKNFNLNVQSEGSSISNEQQPKSKLLLAPFEQLNASENVVLGKDEVKRRKIDNETKCSISDTNQEIENYDETLNRSLLVPNEENSVDLRSSELLNQNIQPSADEIKANEPAIKFSSKNERTPTSSLDNGTTNEVNPTEEDKMSIDGPRDRPSSNFTSSKAVPALKERKSRSSKARTSTSTKPELNSIINIEDTMDGKISTPTWNEEEVRQSDVLSTKIDSVSINANSDIPGVSGITLDRPLELVSTLQDRSTVSTLAEQTVKNFEDNLLNKNVTLSSTGTNQPPIIVETSTIDLANDEDQPFTFDTIFSSLEPNDRDFHVTIDDISSHSTDNSSHELEPLDQWPVKHSAVVEGDLVLGGLMMVHEREDTITCGPVMPQGGVQALEAMLYTLDMLNDREIVPGVKIGAHILDDCDKDTYGLEMAVDFIKGTWVCLIAG